MARPRIDKLVPKDDLPPTAVVQRFITFYINERDLKLAACKASLMPEMGEKLYRQPKVRQIIDRKIMLIDIEEAKVKARANLLTVAFIDSVVYEELKSKKNGHVRVRAAELAYRRTGLIRDGEFYVAPDANVNQNAPSVYQAQITMRRTVTEELVQTAATSSAQVAPKLLAPEVQEY